MIIYFRCSEIIIGWFTNRKIIKAFIICSIEVYKRARPYFFRSVVTNLTEERICACYQRYWVSRYTHYPKSSNPVCAQVRAPRPVYGVSASLKSNTGMVDRIIQFPDKDHVNRSLEGRVSSVRTVFLLIHRSLVITPKLSRIWTIDNV